MVVTPKHPLYCSENRGPADWHVVVLHNIPEILPLHETIPNCLTLGFSEEEQGLCSADTLELSPGRSPVPLGFNKPTISVWGEKSSPVSFYNLGNGSKKTRALP